MSIDDEVGYAGTSDCRGQCRSVLWPNGAPRRHVWTGMRYTTHGERGLVNVERLQANRDACQQWWSWHCTMLSEIRKSGEQEQRNADHKS